MPPRQERYNNPSPQADSIFGLDLGLKLLTLNLTLAVAVGDGTPPLQHQARGTIVIVPYNDSRIELAGTIAIVPHKRTCITLPPAGQHNQQG